MNLERMPSTPFALTGENYLSVEWQNYFTMNSQNMELFFANVGHLVPSRTNSDIQQMNVASASQPDFFKARSLYNNDTANFMGFTNGQYSNYTMNNLTTRASILAMTAVPSQIQYFGDQNKNLYTNVDGLINQIPKNTTLNNIINFSSDGVGNLYVTINGVTRQVTLV